MKALLIALFSFCSVQAQGFTLGLSPHLDQGTDVFGLHNFHLNPALAKPAPFSVQLGVWKLRKDASFIQESNNGRQEETYEGLQNHQAIGILGSLGDSLSVGGGYEQFAIDIRSRHRDFSDDYLPETIQGRQAQFRLKANLAESFQAAIGLRYLQAQYDLIGNYGLGPRGQGTTYQTTLYGTGGGLAYHLEEQFAIAAQYFPALKGKAQILGEEKLVSEPGTMDGALAFRINEAWKAGFLYRRFIYKKDERTEGTTLNNANATPINLLGLDREFHQIFTLTAYLLGMTYQWDSNKQWLFSVLRENMVFVENIRANLPGENQGDPLFSRNSYRLAYAMQFDKIQLLLGMTHTRGSYGMSRAGLRRVWSSNQQDFWFSLGSDI